MLPLLIVTNPCLAELLGPRVKPSTPYSLATPTSPTNPMPTYPRPMSMASCSCRSFSSTLLIYPATMFWPPHRVPAFTAREMFSDK